MAYNREIQHFAPLPSGPLPTQREIDALARNARRYQASGPLANLRKIFQR